MLALNLALRIIAAAGGWGWQILICCWLSWALIIFPMFVVFAMINYLIWRLFAQSLWSLELTSSWPWTVKKMAERFLLIVAKGISNLIKILAFKMVLMWPIIHCYALVVQLGNSPIWWPRIWACQAYWSIHLLAVVGFDIGFLKICTMCKSIVWCADNDSQKGESANGDHGDWCVEQGFVQKSQRRRLRTLDPFDTV